MIVIFASGEGTNFQFLVDHFKDKIALLVCNEKNARVLNRAQKCQIAHVLIEHKKFQNRQTHEHAILNEIRSIKNLKTIVLAGYMRILSPYFFRNLPDAVKIINVHPAHLHDYKGSSGYAFAVAHKFPRWGITVHKVIEELDSGEILSVQEIPVFPTDTQHSLKNRAQPIEHGLLYSVLKKLHDFR